MKLSANKCTPFVLLSVALACGDDGSMTGTTTGTAGMTATGTAGMTATGAAGTTATGTAGMTATGAAGMTGATTCDVVTDIFRVPPAIGESGKNCALVGACHGEGGEVNGVLLAGTAEEVGARLLNTPSTTGNCSGLYIDGANPMQSMLLIKTSPNHASVCPGGAQMPNLPPLLTQAETDCLTNWVLSVAAGG